MFSVNMQELCVIERMHCKYTYSMYHTYVCTVVDSVCLFVCLFVC